MRALVAAFAVMLALTHLGALLHAIGHLSEALAKSESRHSSVALTADGPQAAGMCLECLAYAPLGTFAGSSAIAFAVPVTPNCATRQPVPNPAEDSFRPHFLARAPPDLA